MKARIKGTGEIVEVSQGIYSPYQYVDDNGTIYTEEHLEILQKDSGVIFTDATLDYWTRLEHTYVGMFMKSFLDNFDGTATMEQLSDDAIALAHALVEKLKEKEERK